MGKKYSILKRDVECANGTCSNEFFIQATGMRLIFTLSGRPHIFRIDKNLILVDQIVNSLVPETIGTISYSNLIKATAISNHIISISNIIPKTVTEDNLCCICLDKSIEILLMCGHGFCEKDISDWEARENNCPMCRRTLKKAQMYTSLEVFKDDSEVKQSIEELLQLINL